MRVKRGYDWWVGCSEQGRLFTLLMDCKAEGTKGVVEEEGNVDVVVVDDDNVEQAWEDEEKGEGELGGKEEDEVVEQGG